LVNSPPGPVTISASGKCWFTQHLIHIMFVFCFLPFDLSVLYQFDYKKSKKRGKGISDEFFAY
jgi:hypothetical protein